MITVIDSPCGAGKTQYCIDLMKKTSGKFGNKRFVYITPFITEINRIVGAVPDTFTPNNKNKQGTKIESMKLLLDHFSQNIASTHALFKKFTPDMAELVKLQHLTLILDEVMDVVEEVDKDIIPEDDMDVLLTNYIDIAKDTGIVSWKGKDDYDGKFKELKRLVTEGHMFALANKDDGDNKSFVYFIWTFPVEVFKAFDDVIICTYMFKSQLQRFYYDLYKVPYEMKSVKDGKLIDYTFERLNKNLVNIYNGKLNSVGDVEGNDSGALSVSWYKKRTAVSMMYLKKCMYNFVHNELKAELGKAPKSNDIIWTTYKKYKEQIKGGGFSKGFVPCNLRATNDYINRHFVMYAINRFFNPYIKRFFYQMGISIKKEDEEQYALSEMIQFICRSAIRKDELIYCYIPSERMRNLFVDYLNR